MKHSLFLIDIGDRISQTIVCNHLLEGATKLFGDWPYHVIAKVTIDQYRMLMVFLPSTWTHFCSECRTDMYQEDRTWKSSNK